MVSVVIPVYNVERWLDRCVTSVVNQTYRDMEIILVDDGSPDDCPRICEEWAQKDARIKVIHKENAGLGMARNSGIEQASGEYICFVDSDDYIEANMVEVCVRAAEREQADIICYGNDKVLQTGEVVERRRPSAPKSVYSGEEIRTVLLPMMLGNNPQTGENWNLSLSSCFALFSMNPIVENNWRFVSEREIISEDFYSVLKLYQYVRKVVILDGIFYHYTTNPASLTQTYRTDRYEKIRHFYIKMQELAQEMDMEKALGDGLCVSFLGLTVGCMKQIVSSGEKKERKIVYLRKILSDSVFRAALKTHYFYGESIRKRVFYWACRHQLALAAYGIIWLRELRK